MINLKRDRRRRKKRNRCDGCDGCDCDFPCLDLGLFSTLLTLGALGARLVSPGGGRKDVPLRGPGGAAAHGAGPDGAPEAAPTSVAGPDGAPGIAPTSAAAGRPLSLVDRAGRAAILGYRRWLSHRWPGQCRYTPTCSAYGLAAVERYGLALGGRMAADRLRRCRPDVPCGTHDPVR
ncbi:membrane protein insertion efficiency factor YidD [Micromonospora thermarum]|uniref:membrane protein insertion efficiency factor YidD n=1 Tax=Micromonospora thermarum TaxID=2720024 RepID=UPI002815FC9D|nr:membrane protein insertion efficiency factor YidD [Micromonospora thermarum]